MTFRNPLFLLALVPIAVAGVIVLRRGLRMRPGARWPELATAPRPSAAVVARKLLPFVRLLALSLLVVALARPQVVQREQEIKTEGIDIMLALDISGSMQAEDFKPNNRLYVAKEVISDFLGLVRNDRVGLVVFAGQAFTQCPLTLDHPVLVDLLDDIEVGIAGDRTAIGSGLGTAVKRLQKSKAKSKVVALLTDGRNNAGTLAPSTAAELAKSQNVKVYTIGAGGRGRAPFLVESMFGSRVVYQDVDIDDDGLRAIAEATGGAYYRAEDREALRGIYAEIDRLERTEITTKSYVEYKDRYPWLVVAALALLVVEVTLLGTRLRALP